MAMVKGEGRGSGSEIKTSFDELGDGRCKCFGKRNGQFLHATETACEDTVHCVSGVFFVVPDCSENGFNRSWLKEIAIGLMPRGE